jgi:putative transposase
MPFWKLYYHVVWSTKNCEPALTEANERIIYDFIRDKARDLGGIVFAINGMADHAHLVAAVPPRLAVATFVGQVKGASSALYNKGRGVDQPHFAWQTEYGVFSFDSKRLASVVAYVENQKRHHAQGTTIPILERWDEEGVRIVQDVPFAYEPENGAWHIEMPTGIELEGA